MDKKQLLAAWEKNNLAHYFYYGVVAAIVGLAGLLVFDRLLFAELALLYLPHRLVLVSILAASAGLSHRYKLPAQPEAYRITYLMAFGIIVASSLWYQYFLIVCPATHYKNVLFGNVISVMAIALFTATFPSINKSFIAFCMISFGLLSLRIGSDAYLLIVSTVFAAVVCMAQRRLFATMLYTDYKNKRVIFDAPAAFALTVRRQDQRMDDIFPPRTSAVAILTADIRNSQSLFEANDAVAQAKINAFFTLVHKAVESVAPQTRKMLKTHGDEINVILYSHDLADLPRLSAEIMAIAQRLALETFEEARQVCAPDILYDMGISWGHNLVGLLGAEGLKSPDVYGHVIVEAKRFQELAKRLRSRGENFPIIVAKDSLAKPSSKLVPIVHRPSLGQRISHEEVIVYKQSS